MDVHTKFFNVSSEEAQPRWFRSCGGPWRRSKFIISMYHEEDYCKDVVDATGIRKDGSETGARKARLEPGAK